MAFAGAMTPDAHPLKTVLDDSVGYALDSLEADVRPLDTADATGLCLTTGGTDCTEYNSGNGLAPWQVDFRNSSLGQAYRIGYSTELNANGLWSWAMLSVIERLGDSESGHCWTEAAAFSIQLRDNTGQPFPTTWGAIHDYFYPSADPCTGNAMTNNADRSATDYGAYIAASIATAVETGETGAQAAWDRYDGRTTSWTTQFETAPEWAIQPGEGVGGSGPSSSVLAQSISDCPVLEWCRLPASTETTIKAALDAMSGNDGQGLHGTNKLIYTGDEIVFFGSTVSNATDYSLIRYDLATDTATAAPIDLTTSSGTAGDGNAYDAATDTLYFCRFQSREPYSYDLTAGAFNAQLPQSPGLNAPQPACVWHDARGELVHVGNTNGATWDGTSWTNLDGENWGNTNTFAVYSPEHQLAWLGAGNDNPTATSLLGPTGSTVTNVDGSVFPMSLDIDRANIEYDPASRSIMIHEKGTANFSLWNPSAPTVAPVPIANMVNAPTTDTVDALGSSALVNLGDLNAVLLLDDGPTFAGYVFKSQDSNQDTQPPVISITGDNPTIIERDQAYTDLGATCVDNKDGDISGTIVTGGVAGVDTSTDGDYQVTYDCSDAAGNAAPQAVRTVTVVPPGAPQTVLSQAVLNCPVKEWCALPTSMIDTFDDALREFSGNNGATLFFANQFEYDPINRRIVGIANKGNCCNSASAGLFVYDEDTNVATHTAVDVGTVLGHAYAANALDDSGELWFLPYRLNFVTRRAIPSAATTATTTAITSSAFLANGSGIGYFPGRDELVWVANGRAAAWDVQASSWTELTGEDWGGAHSFGIYNPSYDVMWM
ncbi:MAG: DUF5011 domain-containing protein, partial [Pseudomonadota bacterium]